MIDKNTGEVVVESVPIRLGPSFTRSAFQSSPLSNTSHQLIKNEPFCSFLVAPREISGLVFFISLWFFGEQLEFISLATDDGSNRSWSNWSKEAEIKRKSIHDRWLASLLGPAPYLYNWGEIMSVYDPKAGDSSIIIRYSWKGKPWTGKSV